MRLLHYEIALFITVESVIFFLWYSFLYFNWDLALSGTLYTIYTYLSPVLLVFFIAFLYRYDEELKEVILQQVRSRDVFIFIGVIFVWLYIFSLHGYGLSSLFYAPAIIDEICFRFVMIIFLGKFMNRALAITAQSAFYTLFYLNYLFFEPGGWIGLYAPLYVLDIFMMGILYGGIYFLRKNIYIDLALHNSLYDLVYFVPPVPWWIPYIMLPA